MTENRLKQAVFNSGKSFYNTLPILLGVLLLLGLLNSFIPKETFVNFFQGLPLIDSFIGATMGSILAGTPLTSYILGGELLQQGVGMIAVTAFLVSWVTVGIVQLPAEAMLLGKKFAISRNIISFFFAIIVAIITTILVNVL